MPNVVLLFNSDMIPLALLRKFKLYTETYYKNIRFICVTDNTIIANEFINKYAFVGFRIDKLNQVEIKNIVTDILYKEKKITYSSLLQNTKETINNKILQSLKYSDNNLAKSIFYFQLLYEFGTIQCKTIALRKNKTYKTLFNFITSNNLKNLSKIRTLVYDCTMNSSNHEIFLNEFIQYLVKYQSDFIIKNNKFIEESIQLISESYTKTNKTIYVLAESFILKLMMHYTINFYSQPQ